MLCLCGFRFVGLFLGWRDAGWDLQLGFWSFGICCWFACVGLAVGLCGEVRFSGLILVFYGRLLFWFGLF